jgi:hypothetical protein
MHGNETEQARARIRLEGGFDLTHGYWRRNPAKPVLKPPLAGRGDDARRRRHDKGQAVGPNARGVAPNRRSREMAPSFQIPFFTGRLLEL